MMQSDASPRGSSHNTRRAFLKSSGALAAGLYLARQAQAAAATGSGGSRDIGLA